MQLSHRFAYDFTLSFLQIKLLSTCDGQSFPNNHWILHKQGQNLISLQHNNPLIQDYKLVILLRVNGKEHFQNNSEVFLNHQASEERN